MYTKSFSRILVLFLTLTFSGVTAQELQTDTPRDRRAQTGLKFLTMSVDARSSSMADAMTSVEGTSTSLFYNPAGIARMNNTFDVTLGQFQWIADVSYNAATAAFRPADGMFGVFGVSVLSVDYGTIQETIRSDATESGYRDVGTYNPSGLAIGVGYGKALTDRFAVGGHVKYASQSMGDATVQLDENGEPIRDSYSVNTVAVDFGVIYNTGFESLKIAMSARNFSREIAYAEENFELPLAFQIGMSMNMLDLTNMSDGTHKLLLSIDGERPRDFNEQIKVGAEYVFLDLASLRAGYVTPTDLRGLNVGVGFNTGLGGIGLGVDYSFTQYGLLGDVNRLSARFTF